MKTFLLICFFSLWSSLCPAQETDILDDNISLAIQENEETTKEITLKYMVETAIEIGHYFHTNYPGKAIETDLKPDIEKFFPNATRQELYDKESFIRNSIKFFRWGKEKIAEVKSLLLVPDTPILTYKDSEYENPDEYEYQDVGENQTLIITDIKKVISYSEDLHERKTYKIYKEKNENFDAFEEKFPGIAKLKRVYDKIEIKKLPFYGLFYDDPKTNGEGISPWIEQEYAKLHLASDHSRLDKRNQIKGVLHFKLNNEWAILAEDYEKYPEINITFNNSENIKECHLFRPTPHRAYFEDGDLITYGNNFAYPFICDVIDNKTPAIIKTQVIYSLCNLEKKCKIYDAEPTLTIKNGYGFETMLNNFITQNFNLLPYQSEEDIDIQDVSIENNELSPTGKTLRLIIDNKKDLDKPEIFIRTRDHIKFSHPKIAIDGRRISIRSDILTTEYNLEGQDVEITFSPDIIHSYRIIKTVKNSSIFDINSRTINFGLILLAILGGFILNFMPCVFPVLSLKFISLTQFGAKNEKNMRQNFALSFLGIICGFLFLATMLTGLKILGRNLGWGMQFQNPIFIITMIFAILLFIGQLQGLITFKFPNSSKLQNKKFSPSWEGFLSGLLVVLMATPCTGPYLGTTIGFALAGNISDIYAILMSVALGLSLPYLILLVSPNLSAFVPPPGPWMQKMHSFMTLMLCLTIIWLLSILKVQSSWGTVSGIIFIMAIFYLALYTYNQTLKEVEHLSGRDPKILHRSNKIIHTIFLSILTTLFIISSIIGNYGFSNHSKQVKQQTQNELDFNQIGQYVSQGYNVLIKVGADWCLTCSYNNFLVFDNITTKDIYKEYNIKIINIDWTEYKPEILEFMSEYGRRGLPFYILYNQNVPEGLVLPEILSQMEFENILQHSAFRTQIPNSEANNE